MVEIIDKIDFKQKYKAFYTPKADKPEIVTIPDFLFVMIDGQGDPNTSQDFAGSIEALYTFMYTLKFSRKQAGAVPDFTVGPLEALWWTPEGTPFSQDMKADWLWTTMIMDPLLMTPDEFEMVKMAAMAKKPEQAYIPKVRLEAYDEGEVVQMLHLGKYADEMADIELMNEFVRGQGYEFAGKHHEIYLNDPSRVAPEKVKTILRHPIVKTI